VNGLIEAFTRSGGRVYGDVRATKVTGG